MFSSGGRSTRSNHRGMIVLCVVASRLLRGARSLPSPCHRIASHRIASHRIASHRIASHHIASHRIASHRIASHRIASHRIASHRIASHRIASHRIASHRIASHRIASHRIASHRIASHRIPRQGSYTAFLFLVCRHNTVVRDALCRMSSALTYLPEISQRYWCNHILPSSSSSSSSCSWPL